MAIGGAFPHLRAFQVPGGPAGDKRASRDRPVVNSYIYVRTALRCRARRTTPTRTRRGGVTEQCQCFAEATLRGRMALGKETPPAAPAAPPALGDIEGRPRKELEGAVVVVTGSPRCFLKAAGCEPSMGSRRSATAKFATFQGGSTVRSPLAGSSIKLISLVYSGCSRGMGPGWAKILLARGCTVVATYSSSATPRHLQDLQVCSALHKPNQEVVLNGLCMLGIPQAEYGDKLHNMTLDQANETSISTFAKELAKKVDKVDVLVNNAGIGAARTYPAVAALPPCRVAGQKLSLRCICC